MLVVLFAACAPEAPELEPLPSQPFASVAPEVSSRLAAALADVERLAAERPISELALAGAWGELGKLAHAHELYETAVVAYRNAGRCAPDAILWPYLLGHAELERHEPEAALEAFERAREIDPADGLVQSARARALRALGRLDEALELVERRLEGAPDDRQAMLLGAELAAEMGRPEDAIRRYERLLELQPEATRLWLPLAGLYREVGRAEEAQRALARRGHGTVVAEDGRLASVRRLAAGTDRGLLEAVSAFRIGRFDLAARGFEAALRLRPDDLEVRTNLAATYVRLNRREAAAEELAAVLEQNPGYAPAWNVLGGLHLMGGAEGEGIAAFRRSLELDPRLTGARANLAVALLRSGDVRGALEAYQQVAAEDPTNAVARYGEAVCRSRLEQWREARELLESELERRSGAREFEIALARLLAAAPVPELRDGARALALARGAISRGEDAAALEALAMALAESGDYAAAREAQQRALGQLQRLAAPDRARTEARLRADLERYARGEPCRDPALG